MYILHIETSTKICSVALSNKDELICSEDILEGMNHTALLAPLIEGLLKRAKIKTSDLGAISLSSGPGSFTGLRVGASTAKAMAYSLGIPLLSVSTLGALANEAFRKYPYAEKVMPMIDARRMEVYTAIYRKDGFEEMGISSVILDDQTIGDLFPGEESIIICGDGAKKVSLEVPVDKLIIDTTIHCSAVNLIEPAYGQYVAGQQADSMHFIPFYLKPPNITKPKNSALS